MTKITLDNVGNLIDATTAALTINKNNETIETAFDNTLSRDGTSPNQMEASLDMNSNHILNLPKPIGASSPLRLQDLNDFVGGGTVTNIPEGGTTGQVLSKNSNEDYDVDWGNTVSSVGLVAPSNEIYVTNSPITSSGNINLQWLTQSKKKVFAGPEYTDSATEGIPTFRALYVGDLQDASTVATLTDAQILTNKTISAASNTLTGVATLASANVFTDTTASTTPTTGSMKLAGGLGVAEDINWVGSPYSSYTPTVTASSGTFTTITCTLRYKTFGKLVHIIGSILFTDLGTGAGRAILTLPVAAKASGYYYGINCLIDPSFSNTTAAIGWDVATSLSINISGITAGQRVHFNGIYEST